MSLTYLYGQGREFEPRSDQFLALAMIHSVFNMFFQPKFRLLASAVNSEVRGHRIRVDSRQIRVLDALRDPTLSLSKLIFYTNRNNDKH